MVVVVKVSSFTPDARSCCRARLMEAVRPAASPLSLSSSPLQVSNGRIKRRAYVPRSSAARSMNSYFSAYFTDFCAGRACMPYCSRRYINAVTAPLMALDALRVFVAPCAWMSAAKHRSPSLSLGPSAASASASASGSSPLPLISIISVAERSTVADLGAFSTSHGSSTS
ncbi:hypothetical protein DQ04_07731030 [Trypanosoma grayi]|uniref:hypothetical protein n=1 Tax=Trypanosoma grayi TaxID=71804 RepID=UPI0004F4625A|nr:hypothetical protein DQ04_07731030 [Trypanosoma grayi]KEG08211.1 hypothetical protein DQ04_07731030 [Trypanosoma grayi]